jgi:hypothetical protein
LLVMQEVRKLEPAVPGELSYLVEQANAALEKVLEIVPEEDLDQGREMVDVLLKNAPGMEPAQLSEAERAVAQRLQQLL